MSKKKYLFKEDAVGMDGEFFLVDGSGQPMSSVGLIGGSKDSPEECEGGAYLEDCVAVEINPIPATISEGSNVFSSNILKCMEVVEAKAKELSLSIDITPAKLFPVDQLRNDQASESGCSPSFTAWDVGQAEKIDLEATCWRYASGDLHLSWELPVDRKEAFTEKLNMARYIDLVMGAWEILETDMTERANVYGKDGLHRPTSYGVEVKSPSNFWMRDRYTMEWAFDVCKAALDERTHSNWKADLMYGNYSKHIQVARKNWDRSLASNLLGSFVDVGQFPKKRGRPKKKLGEIGLSEVA
jgi:hypothetical protein